MTVVHTIPMNDFIDHDTDNGDACICGPDTHYLEGGHVQHVHHSLDGREMREQDRSPYNHGCQFPKPPLP